VNFDATTRFLTSRYSEQLSSAPEFPPSPTVEGGHGGEGGRGPGQGQVMKETVSTAQSRPRKGHPCVKWPRKRPWQVIRKTQEEEEPRDRFRGLSQTDATTLRYGSFSPRICSNYSEIELLGHERCSWNSTYSGSCSSSSKNHSSEAATTAAATTGQWLRSLLVT
jgi:hypothetical protein